MGSQQRNVNLQQKTNDRLGGNFYMNNNYTMKSEFNPFAKYMNKPKKNKKKGKK